MDSPRIEWAIPGRLARAPRPDPGDLDAWLSEANARGIRSILCLLDHHQLSRYADLPGGLLESYRAAGFQAHHLPIQDLQDPPIPAETLPEVWRLFRELPGPLLIHCWAGRDRTGAAVNYILERIAEEE